MDATQSQSAAAVTGPLATARAQQTSPLLRPDVFFHVADQLSPNEHALLLRPLCKETHHLLPDATVVQLSQPVPEAAFAAKWGQPGSMNHLSYWRRREAMCLTARSGVLANLRLLAVGPGGPQEVGAAGCGLTTEVFAAAARAGQLPMCQLLRELGCPWSYSSSSAAAAGGHEHVLLWLRRAGCPVGDVLDSAIKEGHEELCRRLVAERFSWSEFAACGAARGGHAESMRWLLAPYEQGRRRPQVTGRALLEAAAYGLDLATLQVRWLAGAGLA
jgi:hypothetical protein